MRFQPLLSLRGFSLRKVLKQPFCIDWLGFQVPTAYYVHKHLKHHRFPAAKLHFKWFQVPAISRAHDWWGWFRRTCRSKPYLPTYPNTSLDLLPQKYSQLGPLGALGRLGCRLTFHPFGSWYVLTWTLGNSTGYSSPMHIYVDSIIKIYNYTTTILLFSL